MTSSPSTETRRLLAAFTPTSLAPPISPESSLRHLNSQLPHSVFSFAISAAAAVR